MAARTKEAKVVTVEQGARFLAITNMALENMLSRRAGTNRFYTFGKRGWMPIDGTEIDDGFMSIQNSVDDAVWSAVMRELSFFRKQLQRNPASYSVTAFGPISLVVE